MQRTFSKSLIFNAFIVGVPVMAAQAMLAERRPPLDLSAARVAIAYEPVALPPVAGPARVAGAWVIRSPDHRVGGLSGLAVDRGALLALSDGGMLIRLDPPPSGGFAVVRPLPVVPGDPRRKVGRDSEALLAAPDGRGWWVAFEQAHLAIRYDPAFREALETRNLRQPGFKPNRGVEALGQDRGRLRPIAESAGASDAAVMPDGREVRLERRPTLAGFRNRVTGLGEPIDLPVGPLDNMEGIATAPLPNGGTRLWIVSDNDGARWRRTLLLAVDVPPARVR